jgi:hypothetical protein
MRYRIKKELGEQIFDGETDTFAQRQRIADYVESGGKGVDVLQSSPGEFNAIWGADADKPGARRNELIVKAFAQQLRTPIKFDKQKDLQQKNQIDSGLRSGASKVMALSKKKMAELPAPVAQRAVEVAGAGAGTLVAPSNVEKVLEDRKALPGQMTGAQKVGDVVDAAVATPLLFKFLGGGKAAVTGVSRTLFSGFDQEADIDGATSSLTHSTTPMPQRMSTKESSKTSISTKSSRALIKTRALARKSARVLSPLQPPIKTGPL